MKLSVIIPTLNAEKQIGLLLSKLYDQTLPPYEIIVVDSSSDDKTRAIAESAGAKVLVIPRNDFRHGRTRNEAAKRAEGDILIFLTQDALPANDEMLSHLTAP
ncbi:MAG: glycosyltransferase family 2 protein, partial [Deltaproteobacteria bacterium]